MTSIGGSTPVAKLPNWQVPLLDLPHSVSSRRVVGYCHKGPNWRLFLPIMESRLGLVWKMLAANSYLYQIILIGIDR